MERVCSRLRLRTRCRFWLETPLSVGASRLTKGAAHVAFNQTQVRAAAKVQKVIDYDEEKEAANKRN